ncbi:MAG: carboxypeptidase regulatory-like domain-containing protein, partial [Opitutaceae bacterium]
MFTGAPARAQNPENAAPVLRGNVTGRVLNEATGQYLRSAIVTVVGTNISTVTESGGVYALSGVPAGEVRVAVAFIGLDAAEATVKVQPGQTVVHDFNLTSKTDDIVKLGEFRVVSERDAAYKALQEKKAALEIKTVMSSDAFGDVSEGNVGEFLKLMPGVQMDYIDADVRTMSIGGLDPKYSLILMDGAPIASAGTSGIGYGRKFEFEQLSISSIETVELSKTPTPDVAGSALAGVVNLRTKGALDRKGRQIRWSASAGLNSHHLTLNKTTGPGNEKKLKIQPNVSLEFSDVILNGKLGVIAGYSFSRALVEQNIILYTYTYDASPANNATEVPQLNTLRLIDAPKLTDRSNAHLRLDYKFTPNLTAWARIDRSTYQAFNFNRQAPIFFGNAVNGPAAASPQVAGVEYSPNSQTTTLGSTNLLYNVHFDKGGDTTTVATGGAFKRGAFRADVHAQMSLAKSYFRDPENGFWGGSTSTLPNLGFRWSRSSPMDPAITVTQLSGPDWRDPASYPAGANPTSMLQGQTAKDQKWTGKADFRYDWRRGEIPVLFKWGGDISQSIRDITDSQGAVALPYLGPDALPNTGDERWPFESNYRLRNLQGGNLRDFPTPDGFAMRQEYRAHPERFVQPTPATLLERNLRNHWDVKEQIDSVYQQTIIKVTGKFDLAPGFRLEKTRSA